MNFADKLRRPPAQQEMPVTPIEKKIRATADELLANAPVLIAYSGGVDSAVLLSIASDLPAGTARGVIADSPSLPRAALARALKTAEEIGMPPLVLQTREMDDPRYAANPINRCYFCKAELFRRMEQEAARLGFSSLAYGENADDVVFERPGAAAAGEFKVLAPLRSSGLGKAEIRQVARLRGLDCADAPAEPCLSSRIPHGIPVTAAVLSRIERAEEIVRDAGFRILRVRHVVDGRGAVARVQVAPPETVRLVGLIESLRPTLLACGFADVEVDPEGYRGRSD